MTLMLLPIMVVVDDAFAPLEAQAVVDVVSDLDEETIQLLMSLAIEDAWETMEEDGLR